MSKHERPTTAKNKRKPSLPPGVYPRWSKGQQSFLVSLGRDSNGKQRWKSAKTVEEALSQRLLFERAKKQEGESLWMLTQEQRADDKRCCTYSRRMAAFCGAVNGFLYL